MSLRIRNSNKANLRVDLTLTGTTRSQFNAAPPIYPFTIPPEGEQESQGYHSEQGSDGYNEVCFTIDVSARRGIVRFESLISVYQDTTVVSFLV